MSLGKKRHTAALDLGGTWLKAALVDENGAITGRERARTVSNKGIDELCSKIADLINTVDPTGKASHLGVAVPGYLKSSEGIVVKSPNIPVLDGKPLKSLLEKATKKKVLIENDATCAAVGEGWMGSSKASNFVFFTLGTGVGGGIVLNGRAWTGDTGRAGELGHIMVDPNGRICGCGARGCLETISSLTGIIAMVKETNDLQWIEKKFSHFPEHEWPKRLSSLALKSDGRAVEIVKIFGTALGIAVSNILNILDVKTFIFGGGISNMFDLFESHIRDTVKQRVFGFPIDELTLLRAELGEDAGLLGAARLAFGEQL